MLSELNISNTDIAVDFFFCMMKSVPDYFVSQKMSLHQCYAFCLKFLPDRCQNILTKQLNKHTLTILKSEINH